MDSVLKLKKPPILEAWIELRVTPPDFYPTWPSEINGFFGRLTAELPEHQERWAGRVTLRNLNPQDGLPQEIETEPPRRDRILAFDTGKTRCVQAGPDQFVFNLRRTGEDYPGFDSLLEQCTRYFEEYKTSFRPTSVQAASLHYLDMIQIPFTFGQDLNLDRYFNVGVRLPDEEAWPLANMLTAIRVPLRSRTHQDDYLDLTFQSIPGGSDVQHARFLLYWKWQAERVDTLDTTTLTARLKVLHDLACDYFRAVATDELWKLFEPEATV